MSKTTQLAEEQSLAPGPKLLIEWSSPWQEFASSIGPAFSRSPAHLAGEAPFRLFPYRKILLTLAGELLFLWLAIWLPAKLERLRPYIAPQPATQDVLYYSGDELPQTEDLGGSESGRKGRAGGQEAHHRTQTIRIARGSSLVPRVVDAPNLKIPFSTEAVANLIAIHPNAGPPPAEGLRSSRTAPSASTVVAPPPAAAAGRARTAPSLDAIIAPAPTVNGESRHALFLDPALIAPAPRIVRERGRTAPSLDATVVAPAVSSVSSQARRSAPTVSALVVPPSPSVPGRETPRAPVQMTNPTVVPPPVSAPERDSPRTAKLTLPAPSVIAPPPSASAPDLRHMPSGGNPDPANAVVQPPPSAPAGGSLLGGLIGKIFGPTNVIPPPPSGRGSSSSGSLGRTAGSDGASSGGSGSVIAPPPTLAAGSGMGGRSTGSPSSGGNGSVVQPPPSAAGAGTGRTGPGTALATSVIAPPPSLSGSATGNGQGNRGGGQGGLLDVGSVSAPAKSGGSGRDAGVVVTSQPGSKVGLPTASSGNLAMSPAGGDKPGLGGTGGGKGLVQGSGPGSGLTGEDSGAAKTGSGHGAEATAHGGISPNPGTGGAGNASAGTPAVPGVSVSGVSSIITLPSFGAGGSSGTSNRSQPAASSKRGFDVNVVGTSRSGGAFNYYGLLPGDNHTTYLQTPIGQATFQYAEASPARHAGATELVSPQLLHADALSGIAMPRLTVACTLDANGNLKDLKMLDSDRAASVPGVMAALTKWKFRPAMRGKQPVEVVAILGFGTDTNDRY